MAKYIILYKGPATDMDDMSDEKKQEIMKAWGVWMEKLGTGITDIGAPMAPGASVVDDGSEGTATELSGYTIIEADSMEDAKTLVVDHPFLSEGQGNFAVDVFELMPVPMDN